MRLTTVRILPILLVWASAVFAQPNISYITNNYSYIPPGLPNNVIAQGSIFDIFGNGLASATSSLQSVPLPTTLNGTSVDVTVSGTTTHAILYYVSPTQIAAILPSATPTGSGQFTVTANGKTSNGAPISVVHSAFGILTLESNGTGPAAVFDANYNYLSFTNAANPGDIVMLWGSGAGPIGGDETQPPAQTNLPNVSEVDIGGISADILYSGRSAYPGLDQINVVVPTGVTPGCFVSVVARSGNMVGNFATIPIAASGRTCAEPALGLTAAQIQTLATKNVMNLGTIQLSEAVLTQSSGSSYTDTVTAKFANTNAVQLSAYEAGSNTSVGSCMVYSFTGPRPVLSAAYIPAPEVSLNAGPSLAVGGPLSLTIPFNNSDEYFVTQTLTASGAPAGTYTMTASGGADIGAFDTQFAYPGTGAYGFNWSTGDGKSVATRSNGVTITWQGTPPAGNYVEIMGMSILSLAGGAAASGAVFYCAAPAAAGQFQIPPSVLMALPATQSGASASQSALAVGLVMVPQVFTAPKLDLGLAGGSFLGGLPFTYQ